VYYFVEETMIHDYVIEDVESDMGITPSLICGNLSGYKIRDVSAILSDLPLTLKAGKSENPLISRANYSARLIRGVVFWSVAGLIIIGVFLVAKWKDKNYIKVGYQALPLVFIAIVACVSWVAVEKSYHRAAIYDSVKYLLTSPHANEVCKKIPIMMKKVDES